MDIFGAVIDWIMAQLRGLWEWLLSLIVVPPPPPWVADAASAGGVVMDQAAKLGHWVPWPVGVAVAGTILAVWIAVLGWKVGQWIFEVIASAL